jgi:broad specificity phosphatase PhoE
MRGLSDDPLSDLGRVQAQLTAEHLKERQLLVGQTTQLECVYTSTLARAIETGAIIAETLKLPEHRLLDLCELNIGDMDGCSESELWDYLSKNVNAEQGLTDLLNFSFPSGEMLSAFLARVSKSLFEISKVHQGSVLLVSHGVVTMVALGMWLDPSPSNWKRYLVANCSISEVAFEPRPNLVRLNETAHLQGQF